MRNERREDGRQNMRLVLKDETPVQTSVFSTDVKLRGRKFKKQFSFQINGGPQFQIEPSKAKLDSFFVFKKETDGSKLVGLLKDGKLDHRSEVDKLLYLSHLNLIPKNSRVTISNSYTHVNTANIVKTDIFETVMPETPSSSSSDAGSRDWSINGINFEQAKESLRLSYSTSNGLSH